MMCAQKGVTYQNMIQIASGQEVTNAEGEADFGMEIDNRLSTSGGRRLNVDDFELLKVLGKGSFGKVGKLPGACVTNTCNCDPQLYLSGDAREVKDRWHQRVVRDEIIAQGSSYQA